MQALKKTLLNLPGWRTLRNIVVFVSDDWGSVRTTSISALDRLRKMGVRVDDCHYMLFDHIESGEDLELLFGLFEKMSDKNGRNPVLTANCLVANPDFGRIERDGFEQYYSESIDRTYKATQGSEQNLEILSQAIKRRICLPQSHGREHLNVARWMRDLNRGEKIVRGAHGLRMFGVSAHTTMPQRASYLAAYDSGEGGLRNDNFSIVSKALSEFHEIFGFASRSFIAPNYVWDSAVERAAQERGVEYIQSGTFQWLPRQGVKTPRRRIRFQGQKNRLGQRYLVRNVHFEPSSDPHKDWIGQALQEMEIAFKYGKPAIISMHRVNFVGGLSAENRGRGLAALEKLLTGMLKRWPNIEFLDAVELGDIISTSRRSR